MSKKLTFDLEVIEEGMENYLGFCIECGAEKESCEPDARNYSCDECGKYSVYGAEEIIMMGLINLEDDE